jgi:hypothetical protein
MKIQDILTIHPGKREIHRNFHCMIAMIQTERKGPDFHPSVHTKHTWHNFK